MIEERDTPVTAWEGPYQAAMIATVLEALAVGFLLPRGPGSEPIAHLVVTGMRAGTMVVLGLMLRDLGLRAAAPALLAWSGMTVAPQLWALGADARLDLMLPAVIGATAYGFAAHALARQAPLVWAPVGVVAAASLLGPPGWSAFSQLLGAGLPWWTAVSVGLVALEWTRGR